MNATRQPLYIRLANHLGTGLAGAGLDIPALDADRLLSRASRKTGLTDFGDESFREGLTRLVDGLSDEAQLSQVGRIVAHYNLVDHLCVRLRLIDYRKHRPEVAQQFIERPVFILGLPRTGTTILFELLGQDPAMRSPASWEVAKPLPPPIANTYNNDKRRRQVARLLPVMEKLAPGFRRIHAVDAHLPQECVYLLASHFMSEQFAYMYNLPSYRQWLLEADMGPAYRWHHDFLQHLQVDCPGDHWVLKSPAHLAYLDTLLAQYPDACVV
ncbi:MAG: sulfotransferase, partial [Halioglobus sp.]